MSPCSAGSWGCPGVATTSGGRRQEARGKAGSKTRVLTAEFNRRYIQQHSWLLQPPACPPKVGSCQPPGREHRRQAQAARLPRSGCLNVPQACRGKDPQGILHLQQWPAVCVPGRRKTPLTCMNYKPKFITTAGPATSPPSANYSQTAQYLTVWIDQFSRPIGSAGRSTKPEGDFHLWWRRSTSPSIIAKMEPCLTAHPQGLGRSPTEPLDYHISTEET